MAKVALTVELQAALKTFDDVAKAKLKAVAKVTAPTGVSRGKLLAYRRVAARLINNAKKAVKDDKKRYQRGKLKADGLHTCIGVKQAVIEAVPLSLSELNL